MIEQHATFDISEAVKESETQYLKLVETVEPIPETVSIVREYHNNLPMAVVSSGQHNSVHTSLRATGIHHLFNHVLSADDIVNCKPAPDGYLEAAKRLGVEPARCLVFEDTDEGLEAGRSAGAQCVDVRQHVALYNSNL